MSEIRIVVKGKPTAWAAPYVVRGNRSFNIKSKQKNATRADILNQYTEEPIEKSVALTILFYMPIPLSQQKKWKKLTLNDLPQHTKKPDIDNCCKFIIDCLKGIVIKDDNQVVTLYAKKSYSEDPQTIIHVHTHP